MDINPWKDRSNITYGITLCESDQLVGAMGLVTKSREEAELGYWIGRDYWETATVRKLRKSYLILVFVNWG